MPGAVLSELAVMMRDVAPELLLLLFTSIFILKILYPQCSATLTRLQIKNENLGFAMCRLFSGTQI